MERSKTQYITGEYLGMRVDHNLKMEIDGKALPQVNLQIRNVDRISFDPRELIEVLMTVAAEAKELQDELEKMLDEGTD